MRILISIITLFFLFACSNNEQKQNVRAEEELKAEYMAKGDSITNLTQAELLKNVSQAMQQGGPGYAIEYCNLRALALKDSLSKAHNCEIRRISTKYRNPVDMAQTESETRQLNNYETAFQNNEKLMAQVYMFDDRIEYYKPIMLAKDACLKCHGEPGKDIAEATMVKINERYPQDLATGFALNDLRGAWKVTFKK
ncbi:MAG: DUF3365 domain-containing protein [Calditrichaeota bacterium]|nr:DUF3365 domain-containing protein [Calditrichota bacterium]